MLYNIYCTDNIIYSTYFTYKLEHCKIVDFYIIVTGGKFTILDFKVLRRHLRVLWLKSYFWAIGNFPW